jgi:hypothetical protein
MFNVLLIRTRLKFDSYARPGLRRVLLSTRLRIMEPYTNARIVSRKISGLSYHPYLRKVRIPSQRLPVEAVLRLFAPNFLVLESQFTAFMIYILKFEVHVLNDIDNLLQTELHKRPGTIEEWAKVNPSTARLQQSVNGVEVGHEIAGRVNEEVSYDDVVVA